MAKLIECIPNFSCSKEKDEATYNALVETAKSVPGCTLFDAQTDGNHNRCVFTLIGSPGHRGGRLPADEGRHRAHRHEQASRRAQAHGRYRRYPLRSPDGRDR